jgi:hypothetical protein
VPGGESPGRLSFGGGRGHRGGRRRAGQGTFGVGAAAWTKRPLDARRRRLEPQPAARTVMQLDRASVHVPPAYKVIRR